MNYCAAFQGHMDQPVYLQNKGQVKFACPFALPRVGLREDLTGHRTGDPAIPECITVAVRCLSAHYSAVGVNDGACDVGCIL